MWQLIQKRLIKEWSTDHQKMLQMSELVASEFVTYLKEYRSCIAEKLSSVCVTHACVNRIYMMTVSPPKAKGRRVSVIDDLNLGGRSVPTRPFDPDRRRMAYESDERPFSKWALNPKPCRCPEEVGMPGKDFAYLSMRSQEFVRVS